MKRNLPVPRDWSDARAKIEEEGACRACGRNQYNARIEAAHTIGREHDQQLMHGTCEGAGCAGCNQHGVVKWVNPDDVIPLCGPATSTGTCHGKQHAHLLDLLPILSPEEQVRAVQVTGSIATAYIKLAGALPDSQGDAQRAAASMPPSVAHWSEEELGLFPPTPLPPPEE